MSFEEVRKLLKQRFPLIMVDKVLELTPGKSITALKNVSGNEIQFLGHFPDFAIMPGTLIVEALGQSASILFSQTQETGLAPGEWLVLGIIDNLRFIAPVLPGSTMILKAEILKMFRGFVLVQVVALVDGKTVAEGRITFGLTKPHTATV